MTGLNASVSAGWYTYTNLGPITTTFTPAPSCTDYVGLGYMNSASDFLILDFRTKAEINTNYDGCTPTTTPSVTATPTSTGYFTSEEQLSAFEAQEVSWRAYGAYYSPAMHCPSGWSTIGMAGRDASGTLTSSGIYVPTKASTSTQSYPTDDFYYYMFNYEDKASVLKDILKPKETMAMCCPRYDHFPSKSQAKLWLSLNKANKFKSGMTADSADSCYSQVKSYTPSVGYQVYEAYNELYGSSTVVSTKTSGTDTITTTRTRLYETGTTYRTETVTTTFEPSEKPQYSAFAYAPAITMLYQESDLHSASAASSTASDASTSSNAAGRVSTGASVWNELASVVGIWAGAAVLGAGMIFPW